MVKTALKDLQQYNQLVKNVQASYSQNKLCGRSWEPAKDFKVIYLTFLIFKYGFWESFVDEKAFSEKYYKPGL